MTKKLKVLGLALVAVFAMNVVVAASAQAAGKVTVPNGAGTALSGAQTAANIFTTTAGEVECSTATFSGTATGTEASEQTVTPTYSGCTLAGLAATVNFTEGGCDYKLTAAGAGAVTTDVVCSTGTIHVKKSGSECEVTVLPQTGLTGITADNTTVGGVMAVNLTINVTGIHYEFHHGEKCPNKPESTHVDTTGTYTGTVQVTGAGGVTVD